MDHVKDPKERGALVAREFCRQEDLGESSRESLHVLATVQIREAMADARRAALETAIAKLDARAQQLSTEVMQGLKVMREHARAEAIYCSELVRALLNAAPKTKHPSACPECGSVTVDLDCRTCCPEDR